MLHAEQLARKLLMLMEVIGVDRAGSLILMQPNRIEGLNLPDLACCCQLPLLVCRVFYYCINNHSGDLAALGNVISYGLPDYLSLTWLSCLQCLQ
jgi:hypothetical protein